MASSDGSGSACDNLSAADFELRARGRKRVANSMVRKTRICTFWQMGQCTRAACSFAHGDEELHCAPDLSKTLLCRFYRRGKCRYQECKFAHGWSELRPPSAVDVGRSLEETPGPIAETAPEALPLTAASDEVKETAVAPKDVTADEKLPSLSPSDAAAAIARVVNVAAQGLTVLHLPSLGGRDDCSASASMEMCCMFMTNLGSTKGLDVVCQNYVIDRKLVASILNQSMVYHD